MWDKPARWDASRSLQGARRIEVWSSGSLVTADAPIVDAVVTDRWVTGLRRSLSMTVEPTSEWLRWVRLPLLEVRPFFGFSWGTSEYLCPMGVYPVLPPPVSLPSSNITFNADDQWSYVVNEDFLTPQNSYPGQVRNVIARLITDTGLPAPIQAATSTVGYTSILWGDKSRAQTIAEAAEAISAEVFYDRVGVCQIRNRTAMPGDPITDGENGTVVNIQSTEDWSQVYNAIAVTSSKQDVTFPAAISVISDPKHPAHESRIGRRTLKYSSPLILTRAQAFTAGASLLKKKSAPALSWTATGLSDPSRDAGDLVTVTTGLGSVQAVIQEVTHSASGGPMTLKLGAP